MYGRVTKVLAWILPIIQSGECGAYKDAYLRRRERIKTERRAKTMDNGQVGQLV